MLAAIQPALTHSVVPAADPTRHRRSCIAAPHDDKSIILGTAGSAYCVYDPTTPKPKARARAGGRHGSVRSPDRAGLDQITRKSPATRCKSPSKNGQFLSGRIGTGETKP